MGLPLFPSLFTTKIPIVFESALMPELPPHFVLNKGSVLCFLLPAFFLFSLRYHRSLVLWPSLSTARLEPLLPCWGQQQWLPALSDTAQRAFVGEQWPLVFSACCSQHGASDLQAN